MSEEDHLKEQRYYTHPEIEEIAKGIRAKYGIGEKYPFDVELLADKMGILLTPIPYLRNLINSLDGFTTNSLDEIIFDANSPERRIRFTIAHEIGHIVLHAKIIETYFPSSLNNWKNDIYKIPSDLWGRIEKEANSFASHLLITKKGVEECIIKQKVTISASTSLKELNISDEDIIEYLAPLIANDFDVSEVAMRNFMLNMKIKAMDLIK